MNKLRSTFLRTRSQDKRSQQFLRRLPSLQSRSSTDGFDSPSIHAKDLSLDEREAFHSWWKDLDPFLLGRLDSQALLKFVGGCGLPEDTLEQILYLFKGTADGLEESQFYAMLRLISHAQNGRKVNRDLVYMGAPVPHFHTQAIDALIKEKTRANPFRARNSWWGQSAASQPTVKSSESSPKQTLQTIPSDSESSPFTGQSRPTYTHGRSLSVPFSVSMEIQTPLVPNDKLLLDTPGITALRHEWSTPSLANSRPEMDTPPLERPERAERTRSLLLTQKFVYVPRSTNPFDSDDTASPFADATDHTSQDTCSYNVEPNRQSISPPLVPTQDTKPPFLHHVL